jgi:hypothetical protein
LPLDKPVRFLHKAAKEEGEGDAKAGVKPEKEEAEGKAEGAAAEKEGEPKAGDKLKEEAKGPDTRVLNINGVPTKHGVRVILMQVGG